MVNIRSITESGMAKESEKKLLVLGHRGMLGRALIKELAGLFQILTCEEADITKFESIRDCLVQTRPNIVINSAAYTDVDGAESNQARAFAVNAIGAGNVAQVAKELGVEGLVHFSTDYVFDGDKEDPYEEEDTPNPINVYGRSKLEGEKMVLENYPNALIIRTAWLYGGGGKNFVDTILKLAQERDKLTVVDDQRGCPTWTVHLARGVGKLLNKRASGLVHLTNSGSVTWFGFAKKIIEIMNITNVKIEPITTEQLGRPARRPRNSVLDCSRYESITGDKMPSWERALEEYIGEKLSEKSFSPSPFSKTFL